MSSIFPPRLIKYNLRNESDFFSNSVNSSKNGLNSIKFFRFKGLIPMKMKNLKSLEEFTNKIRKWEPDGCDCKLCKNFASNLGYVNSVWLWDIHLTVGIRKFCLNSSAMKITTMSTFICLESKCGDCNGVANKFSVDGGGNRVMSRISLWCLYFDPVSRLLLVFLLLILSG